MALRVLFKFAECIISLFKHICLTNNQECTVHKNIKSYTPKKN
jgi:hypothetical protein